MLALNSYYLNLFGRLTLRPLDVVLGGGSGGSGAAASPLAAATTRRLLRFFGVGFFEVGVLPL
jgi:hypothetical protein